MSWRQSDNVLRWDFTSGTGSNEGGVFIKPSQVNTVNDTGTIACDWRSGDGQRVTLDCVSPRLSAGSALVSEVLFGVIDGELPGRAVIGETAQCFRIHGPISSGEGCVGQTSGMLLYAKLSNPAGLLLIEMDATALKPVDLSATDLAALPDSGWEGATAELHLPSETRPD